MFRIWRNAVAAIVLPALGLWPAVEAQTAPGGGLRPIGINDFAQPDALHSEVMSPDGRYVAYLERTEGRTALAQRTDRVFRLSQLDYNHAIRLVDLEAPEGEEPRTITIGTDLPFELSWAGNTRLIVGAAASASDHGHDQSRERWIHHFYWRLLAVDVESGDQTVLFGDDTAFDMRDERNAELVHLLPDEPDAVLVAATLTDDFDLWRVSTVTGQARRIERAGDHTVGWHANEHGEPVFRLDVDVEGDRVRIYRRESADDRWERSDNLDLNEFEDRLDRASQSIWVGNTDDPDIVHVAVRPEGAERRGLYEYHLEDDRIGALVWEHDVYDLDTVFRNGLSDRVTGMTWIEDRTRVRFIDPVVNAHFQAVSAFFGDNVVVVPQQVVDRAFLLYVSGPREPGSLYTYRFDASEIRPLAVVNPVLFQTRLSPVEVMTYTARDGLELTAYVTRPTGPPPPGGHSVVVMPHGGPELRDAYGFDFVAQYFASEGWVVVQPNFRGSDGYGRTFLEAGHGEWGRAMQDDIADAYAALLARGGVSETRVCIAGFSYGGYAAQMGAIRQADPYACAVSVAGVSDLPAFLDWAARNRPESIDYWTALIGDPKDDEAAVLAASPAHRAAEVGTPLLLLHGTEDKVVPIEQSELMVVAMEDEGRSVTYRSLPLVDHDLADPLSLGRTLALMEAFMGPYLDAGATPDDRMTWDELTALTRFEMRGRPLRQVCPEGGLAGLTCGLGESADTPDPDATATGRDGLPAVAAERPDPDPMFEAEPR